MTAQERRRYERSITLVKRFVGRSSNILDLGYTNRLSHTIACCGYGIVNTNYDLDEQPERLLQEKADYVTAFEVLEHLVEPAPVLRALPCRILIASIPMPRLFEKTHWIDSDPLKQHYHEFTEKQFDKLLAHTGYTVKYRERWRSYSSLLGWAVLRQPKHYAVVAERKQK